MKRIIYFFFLVLFSLLILAPPSLFSEERYWSTMKFELSTAVSLAGSLLDSSYLHKYSPPFLSGAYVSNAHHAVNLNGKLGWKHLRWKDLSWGMNAAFAYLPFEKLGFQFQVEYGKPKIAGKNSPYEVYLNYAIGQYPGPPPYPFVFERSYGWPDTEGHLTELCLSLNALARLPVSKRVAFSFSGGLTYFRVEGEGAGLSYAKYWMEDSWFMGETYQLKFKFGPLNKLGFNIGAEFNWLILGPICFILDFRFYGCSKSTLPLDIINEGLMTDPFDQVKATMNLGKITINPSFYRINLGLKYLF